MTPNADYEGTVPFDYGDGVDRPNWSPNADYGGRYLAYADPPYLGQGARYKHPDAARWDDPGAHLALMAELVDGYDGWALSCSAPTLRHLLPAAPEHTRVAAWVKPWSKNGWTRVRYCWEPVLFFTDHRGQGTGIKTHDGLVCVPTSAGQFSEIPGKDGGAKPRPFVEWILTLLDYREGDKFIDLFPGSGAVSYHASIETPELALSPNGSAAK